MKKYLVSRREFITTSIATGASTLLPFSSFALDGAPRQLPTVRQIMDLLLKELPNAPFSQTVDTLKSGSSDQDVTGIVTTMFATVAVIRKAIELKANFIIAHEPTFYNHLDEVNWLQEHDVFQEKKKLLDSAGIVVWRMHDYLHAFRPDGVMMGLLRGLGWEKYHDPKKRNLVTIEPTTVGQIISEVKQKLGISKVKVVGDLEQEVQTVGLMPGAIGGKAQIQFMKAEHPDLLMVGEIQEWETSEYFRDLNALGKKKSLVVLGHSVSEEPGMQWLADWLKARVSSVGISHLASGDPFLWV